LKLTKIKNISKKVKQTYDLSIHNNHNFFANNHLIHNSGYRGEICVILRNEGKLPFQLNYGDRIAQLVVCPIVIPDVVEVDELDDTERGDGGFGSTGK